MNKVVKIVGGLFVIAVVVGAALTGVNFAQAQTISAENSANVPTNTPGQVNDAFRTYMESAMHAALAQALGITEDELDAAKAAGKTPKDIAQEKGIDMSTLRQTMDTARQNAIQQAVTN